MKKIMFNDKYGLTQAVLDGRKTMTRRIVPQKVIDYVPTYQQEYYENALEGISVEDAVLNMVTNEHIFNPPYKVGEVVSIAQSYYEVYHSETPLFVDSEAGVFNKMFVKAERMPHHIKITGIKAEFLHDISDEDCLREGVRKWKEADPWLIEKFPAGAELYEIPYCWDGFQTTREAFAALIDKVSGKGTWDSNPLTYAYTFELVD